MKLSDTIPRAADGTIRAPANPRDHADIVSLILKDAPKTDSALFRAANDNGPPGAKTQSWPAMRLNAGEGKERNRALLNVLAELFELAATPHDNVASVAGLYESDGEMALADLRDEVARDEEGRVLGNPGYRIDCRMRETTEMRDWVDLCAAGANGAYWEIKPDGRRISHCPNFRLVTVPQIVTRDGFVVGESGTECGYGNIESSARSTARRGMFGLQSREAEFYAPRGPDEYDQEDSPHAPQEKIEAEYKELPNAVQPSGNVGATHVPYVADDPVGARQILDQLRASIGEDNFEVLRLAVVDRSTGRKIGEAFGQKYNAASALGTALIRKALEAANDNFPALAKAG